MATPRYHDAIRSAAKQVRRCGAKFCDVEMWFKPHFFKQESEVLRIGLMSCMAAQGWRTEIGIIHRLVGDGMDISGDYRFDLWGSWVQGKKCLLPLLSRQPFLVLLGVHVRPCCAHWACLVPLQCQTLGMLIPTCVQPCPSRARTPIGLKLCWSWSPLARDRRKLHPNRGQEGFCSAQLKAKDGQIWPWSAFVWAN